jgi:hypothetical protein
MRKNRTLLEGLSEEEKQDVLDTFNRALQSAAGTFHGDNRAAVEVARLHASLKVMEIHLRKGKSNA